MIDLIAKKIVESIGRMSAEYGADKAKVQFVIYAETVIEDFDADVNYKKQNGWWYYTPKIALTADGKFAGWKPLADRDKIAQLENRYHQNDLDATPKFDFIKDYNLAQPLEKWVQFIKIYNEPLDMLNIGIYAATFIGNKQKELAREFDCSIADLRVFIFLNPKNPTDLLLSVYVKSIFKKYILFAELLGEEKSPS